MVAVMGPDKVSRRKQLVAAQWDMPGGRRRHRRGRHCGCRERGLLALEMISHDRRVDWHEVLHRLKLVTGVDISTRPVRRAGREGNAKKSTSLRAAAEVKRTPFRRSMTMFNGLKCTTILHCCDPYGRFPDH